MKDDDDDSEFIGRGSKGRTDSDNFFRPMVHGFEVASGLVRAQTAEMLAKRLNEQRAAAEVVRQAQAKVVAVIGDKVIKTAFELQSKIEQFEIGAIATNLKLAQFERNSQYIQAGLGGVGLISDFSAGGGGMGFAGGGNPLTNPMVLGAGILTAGVLMSRDRQGSSSNGPLTVSVPYNGGVITGTA